MVGIPLKLGATKADLDGLIGIHPTNAEVGGLFCFEKRFLNDFYFTLPPDLHHADGDEAQRPGPNAEGLLWLSRW